MRILTSLIVFLTCVYMCSSQLSQLAFQRALQARLNAMRSLIMQSMAQNGMNALPGTGGTTPNADLLRQLNTVWSSLGIQPSGGIQTVRRNRNRPSVVTLNGPDESPSTNVQNNNINNILSDVVQTTGNANVNPDNNVQVVTVNQNLNKITRPVDENGASSTVDTSGASNNGIDSIGFQGGILLPDSPAQTNTTFSQSLNTPFSLPTSSASFWIGSSTGDTDSVSPTQPPVTDSTAFFSIFSAPSGTSFSSSTSSNRPSFESSTWNRFMTGSGSFGPTNPTSDITANENTDTHSTSSPQNTNIAFNTFGSSQPNTVTGDSVFDQGGTQLPDGSVTTQEPVLKCSEEFKKLAGHTLCMTDDTGVAKSGISPVDKQMITDFHNELRSRVMPPAEDLVELKWDERLATVAEKWAKQCTLGHDKERTIPDIGMSVGQNVAVGYRTWRVAVQTWYDEIKDYRYGYNPDSYLGPGGWRSIAHFTQIVHNTTQMIGCGYAECPNTEYVRYYVCNYASAQAELAFPYTAGSRCGQCLNHCRNGLCDCGDLVCYNKGVLDTESCTCKCPKSFKGRSCEMLDCPAKDNWICGRDWPVSFCNLYSNVKEECPYMCGICSGGNLTVTSAPDLSFTSAFGCTYSGLRGTSDECLSYGNKGADMLMCRSEVGSVGCGECDRYFNIKRDYCPVMCGLCDPPCNGMKCSNGGTLDTETCKCSCRPPFTGDTCEYAQCPVNGDPAFCQLWPVRYCRLYYNVPEECPYMCGICKKENPAGSGNTSLDKNG